MKDRKGEEGWEELRGEAAKNSLLWSHPEPLPEPSVVPVFLCYTQWHLLFSGITSWHSCKDGVLPHFAYKVLP